MFHSRLSLWLPILSLITLSACAVAVEEPELSPLRSEDAWSDGQEVYVAKSDIDRVGAELMVQVVELLPGETPEGAAMRVFGQQLGPDVTALVDGTSRPMQPQNDLPPASSPSDVCNDTCRFANDNECDSPRYCAAGTDCSDCGGANGPQVPQGHAVPRGNDCRYAFNGECDEPAHCAPGTDTADCSGGASPQRQPEQPQGGGQAQQQTQGGGAIS